MCVHCILTTAVFLTCPRPEFGRGDEAAVAQHPDSGGGHQPVGEPSEHPGHSQSPDPEERRLHFPQHEIPAGRHTCTPRTRSRLQSDRKARGREGEGLKVQKCVLDRGCLVHFRVIAWSALIGPFLLPWTFRKVNFWNSFCCHLLVVYCAPVDRSFFLTPVLKL